MTIAERRFAQLNRFNDQFIHDINKASYVANSYYRLCALCETNLYLANDERTCNCRSTALSEEREERWVNRLNGVLKEYGLKLVYFGYFPTICLDKQTESGGQFPCGFDWIAYERR